jgi:hypothetical protein
LKSVFSQFKQELDQLNTFYASYKSAIPVKRLDSLGFIERDFPKIENMTPDFLFFKEEYAFVVECKSGFLTHKDAEQLRRYLSFDVKNIEKTIHRSARKRYHIYKYDVLLILWEDIYEKDKDNVLSMIDDHDFDSLKVLTIRKGGVLRTRCGAFVNYQELDQLLNGGIKIPLHPREEIYVTPNAPTEGIVYNLLRKFMSLVFDKEYIKINVSDIYNDWFRSYEIKSNRISESLQFLVKLSILEKSGSNQYIFRKKHIRNSYDIISKLTTHNIKDLLEISQIRSLDYYIEKNET